MTDNDDSLRGIGISPRERLERIEALLGVIDSKLDQKADKADVVALDQRVRTLELHGTSLAQETKLAVERLQGVSEAHLGEMRGAVDALAAGQSHIQVRLSYYAGGLAVLAVGLSVASRIWIH